MSPSACSSSPRRCVPRRSSSADCSSKRNQPVLWCQLHRAVQFRKTALEQFRATWRVAFQVRLTAGNHRTKAMHGHRWRVLRVLGQGALPRPSLAAAPSRRRPPRQRSRFVRFRSRKPWPLMATAPSIIITHVSLANLIPNLLTGGYRHRRFLVPRAPTKGMNFPTNGCARAAETSPGYSTK